jgi:hypothetical protein
MSREGTRFQRALKTRPALAVQRVQPVLTESDPAATYRRCGEGDCVEVRGLMQGRLLRRSFAGEGVGGCCAGSSNAGGTGTSLPSASAGRDRESERDRARREGVEIRLFLFYPFSFLFSHILIFTSCIFLHSSP